MLLFLGWLVALLPMPVVEPTPARDEIWEVAYRDTVRIGRLHTTIETLDNNKIRTTSDLNLTLRRSNALVRVRMEQGTEDSPEGKVVRVFMRQYQGDSIQLNLNGILGDDGKMQVEIDNGRSRRRLNWSDEVLSLPRRDADFVSRKPKPGDRWTQLVYEPVVNTLVTYQITAREPEEVPSPGTHQTLLRLEMKPDPLFDGKNKIQLPTQLLWLDQRFVPVRRQVEMDGLGSIVFLRATQGEAMAPLNLNNLPDINALSLIPLQRKIDRPFATRTAVYKVTVRDDPDPTSALIQDEHQEIRSVRNYTFELMVHPVNGRGVAPSNVAAAPEYLNSNYYINSDDGRIQIKAREAVGDETDPWRKSLRIERWVKAQMTPDARTPLEPAGKIAMNLRGDCRHYAFLTAALCRSQKIPSRTAIGLIYTEKANQPPALGFHMWTEVWINGQWRGLDATLGQGGVSATHIKVTHHSWNETRSLNPLLPVTRVLGKLRVEVVQAD